MTAVPQFRYFTAERLDNALKAVGVSEDGTQVFQLLSDAYSEPERYYHNADHIEWCLKLLHQHLDKGVHREEVELALWFHDAVYDARKHDNEEQSAVLAEKVIGEHGASLKAIERISGMIRATANHLSTDGLSNDANLLLDIDISILGSTPSMFEAYDSGIRREYSWVPAENYYKSRIRVLQSFASQKRLFNTDRYRNLFEAQARINIIVKLEQLRAELQSFLNST